MSDARQRFDALTSKGTSAQSTKSLAVDDVTGKRESIQEAAKALQEGKMPSTNQVTEAIDSARDIKLRESVELSSSGQRVAERFDQVLDSTKQLMNDKNKDNEIQKLIHHSKLASKNLETDADPKDAQKTLQKAYSNLVILSQLIVTSSEFRGLLGDLYNVFRDVLREGDVPGAQKLPSAEEVTTKDGKLDQSKIKQKSQEAAGDARDEAYNKLDPENKRKVDDMKSMDKNKAANQALDSAAQSLAQSIKPIVDKASEGNTTSAKKDGKDLANSTMSQTKGVADEKKDQAKGIANQAQDQAKQAMNQASDAFKNMSLDDQQMEMLADRLSAVAEEVQSHPQYQRAVEGLLDTLYNIKNNAETAASNASNHVKGDGDYDVSEAVGNAKRVVENFAGHYSLDKLIDLLKQFGNEVDKDEKLKKLMNSNYEFILQAFRDKKFIHDDNFNDKAIERFKSSREYILKSYQGLTKSISNEGSEFVTSLKEDPATNRTISDLESLTKELIYDENGKPTIKYDLLKDFNKFIPVLSKHLQRLEIPRISDRDDSVEYILDNITLTCDNIAPRTVRVRTDTEFDTQEDRVKNVISVKMQGIQAAARDVAFYFKKKTLLANIEDAGLVNVVIDGRGLDVFLKLAPKEYNGNAPKNVADQSPAFTVLESKCRVNDINVKFQHGKYDLLYKMFNKVIQSNIRKQIEQGVSTGIRDFLLGVDRAITSHNNQPETAKESKPLDPSPDGWKSDAFGAKQ